MRIVLWDTQQLDASKDFAGGLGVGMYPDRGGVRGRLIRRFYTRDRRPVGLAFAYLVSALRQLGHSVAYIADQPPSGADLYIVAPSLMTLDHERAVIVDLLRREPAANVLVVGLAAGVVPAKFADLPVTLVRGEPEQLFWKLDDVMGRRGESIDVGVVESLDAMPMPNWAPFRPRNFRIGYDFSQFPTALIQSSRGCSFKCNYCPYIIVGSKVRHRDPQAVVDEIVHDAANWGFRSFKFRDPLWGLSRDNVFRFIDLMGRLRSRIQFSIETRIELVPPEVLRALRRVGLTSITVGLETPANDTLRRYHRAPIADDRQAEFVATCRSLGIRTVAGFMIGFPEDTEHSIRGVLDYAKRINPTFANFNIVTPYPGTQFFEEMKSTVADFDYSHYSVYTPVLRYENLTAGQVEALHAKCFNHFYFRWQWLRDNGTTLWPWLRRLIPSRSRGDGIPAVTRQDGGSDGVSGPTVGRAAMKHRGLRSDRAHRPRSSKTA